MEIITGDALAELKKLPSESVHTCVTSPPYFGLRDYGIDGQIGLEDTPAEFVARLVEVFAEVRRVLREDGTLWLNLGDSYANDNKWGGSSGGKHVKALHGKTSIGRGKTKTGLKPKDLIGIPWRVAFALQADGWYLRQDIIWAKPNPMPESVKDRCTKAHEYVFMLAKSARYFYDAAAIAEPAVYSSEERYARIKDDHKRKPDEKISGMRAKVPSGWDQGPGAHIKKDGRYKTDKQRGHGRRHDGFNDRWDEMEKKEQCSGTRNKRSVWTIATQPYPDAHFATFPEELPRLCILAGCPEGGTVLDPFAGAGTTGLVAHKLGRDFIGIELKPEYAEMARKRIYDDAPLFLEAPAEEGKK